jgi:hypothetical protein
MNIFLSLIAASVPAAPPPPSNVPTEYPSGDDYSGLCTKQDSATDRAQTIANYDPVIFADRAENINDLREVFRKIDQGKITLSPLLFSSFL